MELVYLASIRAQLQELEEKEYRDQPRIQVIPSNLVLVDDTNQQESILKRERKHQMKNRGYISTASSGIKRGAITKHRSQLFEDKTAGLFLKPWSQLDIEFQVSRLLLFIKEMSLEDSASVQLRKVLLNSLFRKHLTPQMVKYDQNKGQITCILSLKRHGISGDFYLETQPNIYRYKYLKRVSKIVDETASEITSIDITDSRPIVRVFRQIP